MAVAMTLNLLLLLSFLALQARAEIGGSVVFFDAPGQRFIRSNLMTAEGEETENEKQRNDSHRQSPHTIQRKKQLQISLLHGLIEIGITCKGKGLSMNEVGATISVLLGLAPLLLSADSSLKLNEFLSPNPFDRPHAVFMLEVTGIKDSLVAFPYSNNKVGNAFSSSILGSSEANIELSVDDEVSHLDEPLSIECDAACIAQELAYIGGRYVGATESQLGVLNFPLSGGSSFNLHLAKTADRTFALNLVSLTRNIKKALENHKVFEESIVRPAELLIGRFTGIETLVEEYGSGDIVHQGLELLQTAVTESFELLQKSYGGKIVGVVTSNRETSASSGPVLNVMFSARESRWLAEANPVNATTIAEVILVRRSLAWITGIILLVSTLIGIYYLLYMPLTRDTLLYSNVKLD